MKRAEARIGGGPFKKKRRAERENTSTLRKGREGGSAVFPKSKQRLGELGGGKPGKAKIKTEV